MGKLNNIDKAAAGKGSGINTLWQFVKFIVVSLGACIVQVASLAILYNIPAIKALSTQSLTIRSSRVSAADLRSSLHSTFRTFWRR